MKLSLKTVVAAKFALLALSAVGAGCSADNGVVISEKHGICGNFPPSATYRQDAPGYDFEIGVMELRGVEVTFSIGGHPEFSHGIIRGGEHAKSGFIVLGKERSKGMDRVLYGYNRGEVQGPMYVMAMAPDLSKVEESLLSPGFIMDCR